MTIAAKFLSTYCILSIILKDFMVCSYLITTFSYTKILIVVISSFADGKLSFTTMQCLLNKRIYYIT